VNPPESDASRFTSRTVKWLAPRSRWSAIAPHMPASLTHTARSSRFSPSLMLSARRPGAASSLNWLTSASVERHDAAQDAHRGTGEPVTIEPGISETDDLAANGVRRHGGPTSWGGWHHR
jgi:hypothetical protein